MLHYDKIDILEDIDANKTSLPKDLWFITICILGKFQSSVFKSIALN